ncbi:unnamed protein product, partial [Ectocarpus sp. 8 AP-2014]
FNDDPGVRSRVEQELRRAMESKDRLEERLACSEAALVVAEENMAAERAEHADALVETKQSLDRELREQREAAQAEATCLESRASEAEATSEELRERLEEALRQAER